MATPFRYDLTGHVFARLTVLARVPGRTPVAWVCRCQCGQMSSVPQTSLLQGNTRSCGCLRLDTKPQRTHGQTGAPEHQAWLGMLHRCRDHPRYRDRGIKVCDRWQGSAGFHCFLADMGPHPGQGLTLDRIDGDGDYCPENCRWATRTEQSNNRACCHRVLHNGREKTIGELAAEAGMPYELVRQRITRYGWDPERAINTPSKAPKPRPR